MLIKYKFRHKEVLKDQRGIQLELCFPFSPCARWGYVVNATPRTPRHATENLRPRKRPAIHCTGGWVGRIAGLDGCITSR